ncbi:MAG: hypothetical protein QW386_01135 [Candidatus Bathyarchaeia archaeon]
MEVSAIHVLLILFYGFLVILVFWLSWRIGRKLRYWYPATFGELTRYAFLGSLTMGIGLSAAAGLFSVIANILYDKPLERAFCDAPLIGFILGFVVFLPGFMILFKTKRPEKRDANGM